ncbi:MAG: glycosyltransferase [Chitinophagaceae bacterium]
MTHQSPLHDLVSIIIPCYNHGNYLGEAIESIIAQTYRHYEIIVVDDGSTDDSKAQALKYEINYVFQLNQGLSAARNTGIKHSKGKYLVFLDADDLLFPDALSINLHQLKQNQQLAFVHGAYHKVFEKGSRIEKGKVLKIEDYYRQLLHGNYIGMHATIMYQRWVFDFFLYDVSLKACEDYDIYLKIARQYPIAHHGEMIAVYRIHGYNMSGNLALMLETALIVLKRQQDVLVNAAEKSCYMSGLDFYKNYYCSQIFDKLLYNLCWMNDYKNKEDEIYTIKKYRIILYFKLRFISISMTIKAHIKNRAPGSLVKMLNKTGSMIDLVRGKKKVNMGDFNRITPFSTNFGYERGGPVDRYYIENFLQQNELDIFGRVLEIGDNEYSLRYGGSKITKSDILHISEENKKATFIGDLSDAPHLPDDSFDCIILTQTLQFIYNYKAALHTCYRILKPGGSLMMTVPGISHIDHGEWRDNWFWSFTKSSIVKVLSEVFPPEKLLIETHGNVLVAAAFLYGLGLPELRKEQMDLTDPHYQVIITAKASKPL